MCVTFQRKYLFCGCEIEDSRPCPKQGDHSFPTLRSQTHGFCPDHQLTTPELKRKLQRRFEREVVTGREQEILERMNARLNALDEWLTEPERRERVAEIKDEAKSALVALGPESEMGMNLARDDREMEKEKQRQKGKEAV